MSGRLNVEGRVSVILAVYNGKPYVFDAIQSILDQTYKDIELIIVDDGSTDYTMRDISDKYNLCSLDIPFRIYNTNGPNYFTPMGGLWPYIVGAGNSTGEFLSFHSQDDLSHPDRFKKLVGAIGNKTLVCSNVRHIKPTGNTIKISGCDMSEPLLGAVATDDEYLPHIIFSSSMFRNDQFFKRQCYLIGQYDYEKMLGVNLLDKDGVGYVPEELYMYREHQNQASLLGSKWGVIAKSYGYEQGDLNGPEGGKYCYGYLTNREMKKIARERIGI